MTRISIFGLRVLYPAVVALMACDSATAPPELLSIRISVATTGAMQDLDPDGYTLVIDDGAPQSIRSNSEIIAPDIQPGTHTLQIAGLAANCSVEGSNPRSVVVSRGSSTTSGPPITAFSISCAPNIGTLSVSINTSGSDLDPDGYTLTIGSLTRVVTANGKVSVESRPAQLQVALDGIAANCSADKTATTVAVAFKVTTEVVFNVTCVAAGSLRITASSSGVDLDPDGYQVTARLSDSKFFLTASTPTNGTIVMPSLRPGQYVLTFSGLALNCSTSSAQSIVVDVAAERETSVTVGITCVTVSQIAFVRGVGPDADIWIMNANGTESRRLTNTVGSEFFPAWSPDRSRIAYGSDRDGSGEIYIINVDGTKDTRVSRNEGGYSGHPAWSPDGTRIAFESSRDGNIEIYTMNPDGSSVVRLTNNNSFDLTPSWSPDGRKMVFASDRSGTTELYTMDADGSNVARLNASTFAASSPHWSPDGSRILMNTGKGPYIVNIDGSGLRPLFSFASNATDAIWAPDGRTIAFVIYASCSGGFDYYGPSCSYMQVANLDGTLLDFRIDDAYQPAWGK